LHILLNIITSVLLVSCLYVKIASRRRDDQRSIDTRRAVLVIPNYLYTCIYPSNALVKALSMLSLFYEKTPNLRIMYKRYIDNYINERKKRMGESKRLAKGSCEVGVFTAVPRTRYMEI